jgi:hypothetical protein
VYGRTPLTASGIAAVAKVTGDSELALTALVVRAVEREHVNIPTREVLAAERRIVAARFAGSTSAYRAALTASGASVAVARGVLGDELRRRAILERLRAPAPTGADVARFRGTHPTVLARRVAVAPAPSWLPGGSGVALDVSAPAAVFRLPVRRTTVLRTAEGRFSVRALGDALELAVVPDGVARSAILRELRSERRAAAYAEWTIRRQKAAEGRLVCDRDRMPELGVVVLSSFLPFLSLHEAQASRWAASLRR